MFPVARIYFFATNYRIYNFYLHFFKNQNQIAYFELKLDKTFVKNENNYMKFVFLFDINSSAFEQWISNMSFALETLANNINISCQCLNKSLKKLKIKNRFSHLRYLTCYGKQTCFYFCLYYQVFLPPPKKILILS